MQRKTAFANTVGEGENGGYQHLLFPASSPFSALPKAGFNFRVTPFCWLKVCCPFPEVIPLQYHKILDTFKLKTNCRQQNRFDTISLVEICYGKKEKAGYQYFLLFNNIFKRLFLQGREPFPKRKIDSSKLKEFADDCFRFDEKWQRVL